MKHKYTIQFSVMQFMYWCCACLCYAYSEHFLTSVGFQTDQVGIITAAANIASICLQPLLAALADREKGPTLRPILLASVGFALILAILLLFPMRSAALIAVLFAALTTVTLAVQPLLNTVGFFYINEGHRLDYSFGRGLASVGYAVSSILLGLLAKRTTAALMWHYIACAIGVLIMTLVFAPRRKPSAALQERPQSLWSVLRTHPRLPVFLLGTAFLFLSHNFTNSYMLSIMRSVGGSTDELSIAISIAAWVEVPVMLLFSRFLKKFSVQSLLRFCTVALALRVTCILLSVLLLKRPWGILLSQLLQMPGYAIFMPASSYYANRIVGESDSAKAQMLLTEATSVGCVLSLLLGGFSIRYLGVPASLAVITASAFLGVLLVFLSIRRTKETD